MTCYLLDSKYRIVDGRIPEMTLNIPQFILTIPGDPCMEMWYLLRWYLKFWNIYSFKVTKKLLHLQAGCADYDSTFS